MAAWTTSGRSSRIERPGFIENGVIELPVGSMPCSYVIDTERRLVISTAWGVVTGEEALEHQNKLAEDQAFHPEFNQLLDCGGVSNAVIDLAMIRTLTAKNLFSPSSRRGLVAKSKIMYGTARMFQSFREIS